MQSQRRDEALKPPNVMPGENSPNSVVHLLNYKAAHEPGLSGVDQMARATSLIEDLTKKCADLRVEHAAQTRILLDIEAQLKATERLLFDQLASTSPVHRVPTEVLCIVFRIHALDHAQSAWPLMHICRAWRLAALTTPILWSRIMLTRPERGYAVKNIEHRTSEGYEICSTPGQVIRALRRAGATPLDLWINFRKRSVWGDDAGSDDGRSSESSSSSPESNLSWETDYRPTETSNSSESSDTSSSSSTSENSDSASNPMRFVQSEPSIIDSDSTGADGSDGTDIENDLLDNGDTDDSSYTDSEDSAEDESDLHEGSSAHHSGRIRSGSRRRAKQRHIEALIDSIKRTLQKPRLRSLRIDDKSSCILEETFAAFDFSGLEVLRVCQGNRKVFEKAASEAGELHTVFGRLAYVRLLKGKKLLLREVRIFCSSEEISPHKEQDLFNPESLVILDIQRGMFLNSPDFQLPKLEHLRLRWTRPLWPIQCPNLTHLTLGPLSEYDGCAEIVLPRLLYLSYIGRSGRLLSPIDAPSLHTLQLELRGGRYEIRRGLRIAFKNNDKNGDSSKKKPGGGGGRRLNPVVFRCLDFDGDARVLARILSGMTRCEEFYSTNVDLNPTFFEMLIPKQTKRQQQQESTTMTMTTRATKATDITPGAGDVPFHHDHDHDQGCDCDCEWSIPLPNLQRLVGYMPSGGSSSKRRSPDRLRAMVHTFLERRKEVGVPMEKLSLRYNDLAWKDIVNGELGTKDYREGHVF
ncbi:hypothetical protein FRC17_010071 [Serendipita sp. 399]|nr:hypothetical protein FRC17_010071 [Serendipita sp. 399]